MGNNPDNDGRHNPQKNIRKNIRKNPHKNPHKNPDDPVGRARPISWTWPTASVWGAIWNEVWNEARKKGWEGTLKGEGILKGEGTLKGRWIGEWKGIWNRLLAIFLPHRCVLSGRIITDRGLDGENWKRVDFIAASFCDRCAAPLDLSSLPDPSFRFPLPVDGSDGTSSGGHKMHCLACRATPPPWQRARAAFAYRDGGRDIILAFKHGDRTDMTTLLSAWLARAGRDLMDKALLVPVPLHPSRLFLRRYNQSALLTKGLARHYRSCRNMADGLIRTRRTTSQGHMGTRARYRNVRGAFTVNENHRSDIKGADVVLVDDIITSGATASACTGALLAAGARRVDLLTLARTARPAGQ